MKVVKRAFIVIPLVTYMLLSGCSTTVVQNDLPCPLRPELTPIPAEMQLEIAPHVIQIIADNQLRLKRHIKDLEILSACQ